MTEPLFYWIDDKRTNRSYERDTDQLSAVCDKDPPLSGGREVQLGTSWRQVIPLESKLENWQL